MTDTTKKGLRGLGALAVVAFVFAWFGVYGTANMPFAPRFGFWFITIALGFGAGNFVEPWVTERLGTRVSLPLQLFLTAALISIPVTLLLLAISPDPFSLLKLAVQYGYVLVVSLVLTVLNVAYRGGMDGRYGTKPVLDPDADPATGFVSRLPIKYRTAALYAVSAEDHYLRVHTSHGEELILMRLADALRELADAKGLQTHRSWWVALDGVSEIKRDEGKISLQLKSGGTALVSRRYAAEVKAAGLS